MTKPYAEQRWIVHGAESVEMPGPLTSYLSCTSRNAAELAVARHNATVDALDAAREEIDSLRRERDVLLQVVKSTRERDAVRSLIVQGGGTYSESLDEKARLKAFRATDAIGGKP